MIQKWFIISLLLSITTLYAQKNKDVEMMPYDYYKKKAIQSAQESEKSLQEHFNTLIHRLKENPPTGEKEHDAYILKSLEQNQQDWLAYQYSYCRSEALIEVYPSSSRLYTQTMHTCLVRLNKERINYLDQLITQFRK